MDKSENIMCSRLSIVALCANDPGKMPVSATDRTPGKLVTSSFHRMPDASRANVYVCPVFCTYDFM